MRPGLIVLLVLLTPTVMELVGGLAWLVAGVVLEGATLLFVVCPAMLSSRISRREEGL